MEHRSDFNRRIEIMSEDVPMTGKTEELRIVVGVDGSACSLRALAYAAHEAARLGALLHIVTAYEMLPAGDAMIVPVGLIEQAAETDLREALETAQEVEPEVLVKGEVVFGAAGPVLAQASEGATSLVVGTRGHGHIADMLLGSVSEYAVQHAPCTTVVVR
jgi:nucleotide-binding universal stress UspA family protein